MATYIGFVARRPTRRAATPRSGGLPRMVSRRAPPFGQSTARLHHHMRPRHPLRLYSRNTGSATSSVVVIRVCWRRRWSPRPRMAARLHRRGLSLHRAVAASD